MAFLRWFLRKVLSYGPMPRHIACILDGNRRYAKRRKLKETDGYEMGYCTFLTMIRYCCEMEVQYLTGYIFSIDNFRRSSKTVQFLMGLLLQKLNELLAELSHLNKVGIRILFLGRLELLEDRVRGAIQKVEAATAGNNKLNILLCIAYTSTDEIVRGVNDSCRKKLAASSSREGKKMITVYDLEEHMDFKGIPDVDILIRTSGETRLSNCLLWQTCESILYAPTCLWPELTFWHLVWAILEYQKSHPYFEMIKKKQKDEPPIHPQQKCKIQ